MQISQHFNYYQSPRKQYTPEFKSKFVATDTLNEAFTFAELERDKRFIKAVRKLLRDKFDRNITVNSLVEEVNGEKIYKGTTVTAGNKEIKVHNEPIKYLNENIEWEYQDCRTMVGQDSRLAIIELAGRVHDRAITALPRKAFIEELLKIKHNIFKDNILN